MSKGYLVISEVPGQPNRQAAGRDLRQTCEAALQNQPEQVRADFRKKIGQLIERPESLQEGFETFQAEYPGDSRHSWLHILTCEVVL